MQNHFDYQLMQPQFQRGPLTFNKYSSDKDLRRLMRYSCLFTGVNDKAFLLKLFSAVMVEVDNEEYQLHPFFKSYYYDFLESKIFNAIDDELKRLGKGFKRTYLLQVKKDLATSIADAVLKTSNQKEAIGQMKIDLHKLLTQKLQLAVKSTEVNQERSGVGAFIRDLLGKLLTWLQPSKNWNFLFHTRTHMTLDTMNSKMVTYKI